jgi:hypothetical protein
MPSFSAFPTNTLSQIPEPMPEMAALVFTPPDVPLDGLKKVKRAGKLRTVDTKGGGWGCRVTHVFSHPSRNV